MAGELFVIQCTTCGSRLKVRDAAVIGHILSCPKCNGMVLIQPPADFQHPSVPAEPAMIVQPQGAPHAVASKLDDAAARETLSDSDFNDIEKLLDSKESVPAPAVPSRTAPPPPGEMVGKRAKVFTAADSLPASAEVASVAPDFVSPAVKRWRFVAMLAGTSVMGIFLAIGVAFFFAAKSSPSPAPLAQQPDATLEPKDQKTLEHPPVENPSDPMPPDAPPDVEEKIPTESNPAEKPPSEANKEPTESTEPPVVEQPMPPPQPMPIVEVDEPKSPVNPANDPLKLADLRKLDRLLAPNAAPPEPTEKPSAPATPEDLATTSEPLPRPEMRKVNAQARLADKIAFLDCQGRPVLDFLQVVSDFSTVPISLDPWALAWSRITPDQPLKNQMTNVTVLQALQQTMQPFRLEPVVHDNHVWITRSATPRTIPYPCDGLVNDAKQLTQLASMVKALTPDAWSAKEHTIKAEGTTLTIHNTEAVHIQILELLERLRVARGLPIKSKFPVTMFSLETRTARMRVKLAQPLTLNYAQPTPLAKILKQFHQETGIHFLVDWYALAQEGWPTDSEASVVLDKTPLGGALSKLLHPMDLDFHIIDDQTIQVTSRTQLESTRELELHRVADLLSSEETETSLAERMQAVMGDRVLARYDAPSRTFFVLASQPDQQKLAGLLDSWRRMAGK